MPDDRKTNKPRKYESFHWLRAGKKTKIISVRVPKDDLAWLHEQAEREGITFTALMNRVLVHEMQRVKALGPNPTADELEYGRI